MMKKSLILAAMLLFTMVCYANSYAAPLAIEVGDGIVIQDGPGVRGYIPNLGYGGAFEASSPYSKWDNFLTFCLEADETIAYNQIFYVDGITIEAQKGGVNTDSGDPLEPFTAWIYNQAISGAYGSSLLDDVQNAIWYTEQEILSLNASAKAFYDDQYAAFLSSGWIGLGNVRVLNLVDAFGNFRQDVLASVSTSPEPSAAFLLGLGLLVVAAFERKRIIKNK